MRRPPHSPVHLENFGQHQRLLAYTAWKNGFSALWRPTNLTTARQLSTVCSLWTSPTPVSHIDGNAPSDLSRGGVAEYGEVWMNLISIWIDGQPDLASLTQTVIGWNHRHLKRKITRDWLIDLSLLVNPWAIITQAGVNPSLIMIIIIIINKSMMCIISKPISAVT